jgi:hypothetical protein
MPTAALSHAELLRQRLDEGSSSDDKYRAWPDQLEVVEIKLYDQFDPHAMYAIGQLVGRSMSRRVPYEVFSHKRAGYDNEDNNLAKIRQALPRSPSGDGYYTDSTLIEFHFSFVGALGQQDDLAKRNIKAAVAPPTRWMNRFDRAEFTSHGLVVTIGCKHDYDDAGSNHQRGYHKGRCRKCGHTFMRDSSD